MSKVVPGEAPFDPSRKGKVNPFAGNQVAKEPRDALLMPVPSTDLGKYGAINSPGEDERTEDRDGYQRYLLNLL